MKTNIFGLLRDSGLSRSIAPARLAVAGLALLLAVPAMAGDYQLGPQDKLNIRIAEWQTVEGTFRDWSAINGEYSVGPAGTLSVPFAGELPASGKTTAEIAAAISETLQRKLALSDKPEASVEMVQFRPFYISGEVQNPGQFPYVPELTVLKAVSVAGGIRRNAENGPQQDRDLITAKGNYDIYDDQRLRLIVRRARIDAELADKTTFEAPKEVADDPKVATIIADEMAVLTADQKKLKLKLQALDDLKNLLQSEIESLQKKIVNQQRQVDLAKQQLDSVGALAQKGLVVQTRVLNSEQTIADLQGQILDYDTAILTAKQSISKATQDAIDAENTLKSGLASDRQQIESDLKEAELRVGMQKGLMTVASDPATQAAITNSDQPALQYALVRVVDGKTSEVAATEDTPVQPGDVIKVKLAPMTSQ